MMQLDTISFGHVYLIMADFHLGESEAFGIYKIGMTAGCPKERVKQLQTGNDKSLKLVKSYFVYSPKSLERDLHKVFKDNRIQGEWFRLGFLELKMFGRFCREVESSQLNFRLMEIKLEQIQAKLANIGGSSAHNIVGATHEMAP